MFIIEGTLTKAGVKQKISCTNGLMLACVFACLHVCYVTLRHVSPASNKVTVWLYYFTVLD
jgi:hypothetical protein